MPSLSLTKTASNGLAHDASHVNTPLTEVETWANTTKIDYLNVQDNGLRTSSLRTHAQVEAVRIKVRNATGSSIAANSLIYFNGTYSDGTNNYPTIAKAVTATSVGSTFFAQAVTTGAIANGADGTAAIFFELTGQNTSSGTVGDSVYLDTTAGGWTRTRPTGGQYVQVVGTITVVNASSGRVVLSLGSVPEHLTGGSSGLGATFQTLTVQGASGGAADIYHISDAGEDNADKWKISVADGGNMTWENYTSGSYAAKLTLTSAGAVTTAGALNIGSVSAAGEDTDKFLVLDSSSNVDYRTGAQVLSDIGAQASGTYTTLAFKTIAVSGQDNVVADAADDTLTLAAGSNITITTTAGSDTVTIAGSAGGIASVVADTSPQLGGDLDVNGNSIVSDASNENIPITPHGTGSVVVSKIDVAAGEIDGTAIGANSASTGAFTTLAASGTTTLSGDQHIANGNGLVVGNTAQIATGGVTSEMQVQGTGDADSAVTFARFSADASAANIFFLKSRNGAIGSNTIVQDNDRIGQLIFCADDGEDYVGNSARIWAEVDGTPEENKLPGALVFGTTGANDNGDTERMRIDASGRVGIGTTGANYPLDVRNAAVTESGFTGTIKSLDSTALAAGVGAGILLGGVYQSGGGQTSFAGIKAYKINSTNGDYGGGLQLYTRANGSDQAERMRIDSSGNVGIGTTSPSYILHTSAAGPVAHTVTATNQDALILAPTHASYADHAMSINVTRPSTSSYSFLRCRGDGTSDTQFLLLGSGTGQADLTWSDNSLDYAEYFESSDGSALEVGRSVVMDGDKVKVYNASSDSVDNIIGVVRPKGDVRGPSSHGSAWNHWHNRYLTDDYGRFLREDVTVWEWDDVLATESDVVEAVAATYYAEGDDIPEGKEVGDVKTAEVIGVAVGDVKIEAGSCYERDELAKDSEWTPPAGATSSTQSIRKANPEYDESLADDYTSREFRDEWAVIGLLGQVPVKANEATNPRWIKMKQISDNVDLWLVR